ncbi:MAG: TonB-dependent receptor [Thermomonas sp.]|uniref:TonB-dependent receptor plug domain-containing protein n=1 Tax=Thermomonas sp. TaxID=1971895 RepID=UPI0039E21FD6
MQPKGVRLNSLAVALCAALAVVAAPQALAQQAQGTTRVYAIPGQPLGTALNKFAEASDLQIMIPPELVQGKNAPALNGQYSTTSGLKRLLAGSGLTWRTTQDGVIFIARADAPQPRPAAAPKAPTRSNAPPSADAAAEETRQLETVVVTGSRLRSIVGVQGANPVLEFSREDIERSGVTTLDELRNLIPQLSVGQAAAFTGNSSGGSPDGRLLFDIRGLSAGNTLVLLDGKRLPMTGQRTVASAYEATGIPLSAIERVEVLLGGGSAIYGSDAVGGVVNIITRDSYKGTEIEYARDDTFDTDAANDRISVSHAFRKNDFGLRVSAMHATQNALARRDRWWLASDDMRFLGGSNGIVNAYPIGGRIQRVSNANLPGLTSRNAYIPRGADGLTNTVDDYANAVETPLYDSGQFTNAVNEYQRSNVTLHLDYQLAEWAELYGDYMYSRNESEAIAAPVQISARLPADYAGNPFGVPIWVDKYLWELGTTKSYLFTTQSAQLGMRGDLPKDWRYDFYLSDARSVADLPDTIWSIDTTKLNAAIADTDPSKRPILLDDNLTGAGSEEFFRSLLKPSAIRDTSITQTASLSFDGALLELPAGPIKLALGTEFRRESYRVERDQSSTLEAIPPASPRRLNAQYAEVSMPVFSPSFAFPMMHELTLGAAVRRDDYSDFGTATKPLANLLYKPVAWLAFRASNNKAFRVPYLVDLTRPRSSNTVNVPVTGDTLIDTYRNNEQYIGRLATTVGGNPNLKPEDSEHRNYGVMIQSPFKNRWLSGLSLSVDRWESDILNRIGSITRQEMLDYFPEAFTRAELTDEDRAAGYTYGRIIHMENVSRNIARYRAAGFDYAISYHVDTGIGQFSLDAKATRTTLRQAFATPDAPPSVAVSERLSPTRTVTNLAWQHRGMGASVTAIQQQGFPVSLSSSNVFESSRTWNANVWYDFRSGTLHDDGGMLDRVLGRTRVSLGLLNATDAEPPMSQTGSVNGSIDPRLRRYTFTLRYSF